MPDKDTPRLRLPVGPVDFNRLHDALLKKPDAVEEAVEAATMRPRLTRADDSPPADIKAVDEAEAKAERADVDKPADKSKATKLATRKTDKEG